MISKLIDDIFAPTTLKRYNISTCGDHLEEHSEGEFCLEEDVRKLEEENAALKQEIASFLLKG